METVQETGADSPAHLDSLANLEERITRAVQVITDVRAQNVTLTRRVAALEEEVKVGSEIHHQLETHNAGLLKQLDDLGQTAKQLTQELDDMRGERKQVRSRIEKLLSQLDLLSAS